MEFTPLIGESIDGLMGSISPALTKQMNDM